MLNTLLVAGLVALNRYRGISRLYIGVVLLLLAERELEATTEALRTANETSAHWHANAERLEKERDEWKQQTALDLDAIEQRAAQATTGPWGWDHDEYECAVPCTPDGCPGHPNGFAFVDVIEGGEIRVEDATFIAHARTDVPALVKKLRGAREILRMLTSPTALHTDGAPNFSWSEGIRLAVEGGFISVQRGVALGGQGIEREV